MEEKKALFTKKRIIAIVIAVIVAVLLIIGIVKLCGSLFSNEIASGNLGQNRGIAAFDGSLTFYNKDEKGLIKVKGNKEYQIVDESPYSITVVGDTVYYTTISNTGTIDLKSVKNNGENLTKIAELSSNSGKFYIDGDYVYYSKTSSNSGIARISLKDNTESMITNSMVSDFVLDDKVIYLVDSTGYLYSVNLDGSNYKEITKDYKIHQIQILNKWIYFYDQDEGCLCKIKKDGTDKQVAATFVNNEIYNVTSKRIYYYNAVDRKICECDLKGKKSHEIVSISAGSPKINVANNVIYYFENSTNEGQLFETKMVRTNGKEINHTSN